jgi:type I restriction enzyme S subunit
MAADYPITRIGELASSISETHKFGKGQLIFLNTSDILHGKFLHRTYSAVKDWPGQAKKSIRKHDILFSEIRPANGRWAYVEEDANDFVVSTKLMVIRAKQDRLFPKFLYQFLTSPEIAKWLQHLAESRSGTFPQITFDQVATLELPLPPLAEQKAIAAVLGALDAKIELNQRMNATLEAMARALFQSWFVDFDPVRAKLDRRQPVGLDKATAALFPDSFQDSEGGHIPKGWTVGKVSDLATLNRGAVTPGDFPTETFDHFSLPAFDNGRTPKVELGSAIMSNKFTVMPNSVLLSKLNPHIPRIWMPDIHTSRRSVCSTEFMVACSKPGVSREYLFSLFSSSAFASTYGTLVSGTTGSHQRIRPENVLDMKIVTPSPSLIRVFTDIAKPMFDRINRNTEQSRTLATLRDTLLPKLLSGELRVREGEAIAEQAA